MARYGKNNKTVTRVLVQEWENGKYKEGKMHTVYLPWTKVNKEVQLLLDSVTKDAEKIK